jgi:hypothetical protein
MSKQKNVSPMNSETMYLFHSWAVSNLEGNILTFIDASIQDQVQRKALKDLLRPMIWNWAIENNREQYYEIKQNQGNQELMITPQSN